MDSPTFATSPMCKKYASMVLLFRNCCLKRDQDIVHSVVQGEVAEGIFSISPPPNLFLPPVLIKASNVTEWDMADRAGEPRSRSCFPCFGSSSVYCFDRGTCHATNGTSPDSCSESVFGQTTDAAESRTCGGSSSMCGDCFRMKFCSRCVLRCGGHGVSTGAHSKVVVDRKSRREFPVAFFALKM